MHLRISTWGRLRGRKRPFSCLAVAECTLSRYLTVPFLAVVTLRQMLFSAFPRNALSFRAVTSLLSCIAHTALFMRLPLRRRAVAIATRRQASVAATFAWTIQVCVIAAAGNDKPNARCIQASAARKAGLLSRVIRACAIAKGGSIGRKHDNDLCPGQSELIKSCQCAGASKRATMLAQDEGLRELT